LLALTIGGALSSRAESVTNVIFILGDDQAWWDYSFMYRTNVEHAAISLDPAIHRVAETPAIDRLADEGLTFTHGYTTPLCRPSLASIFTGMFPHQHLVTGNNLPGGAPDEAVENRMQVVDPLPRILGTQLGYTSFQTGKWWEGDYSNGGFTDGDTVNSVSISNPDTRPPQWSGGRPSYVAARHGDWGLMIGRVDYVNDVAAPTNPVPYANTIVPLTDFIDAQVAAGQPFFVAYNPFLPHTPHDPPVGLLGKYDALVAENNESGNPVAEYYANIERFDGGVGAILDYLDAKGIAGNTIVVLICDNGWITNDSGAYAPKSKQSPYEGGVRTPIIVRWPDRIKAGGALPPQFVTHPVSLVDLVPTVLHAVGLEPTPDMTGVNLLDLDAVTARTTIFGEDSHHNMLSFPDPSQSLEARFAIRDGWKLILFEDTTSELYHLYDSGSGAPIDPFETNDLSADNPIIISNLTAAIEEWYTVSGTTGAVLVAHWKFDETSGQTAVDSAGTSDGQLGSAAGVDARDPTINQPGKLGRAYRFDDSQNDVVALAASLGNFSALTNGTLVGWFNTSSTPRGALISYRETSTNDRLILEMEADGNLRFIVREDGSNATDLTTTATFDDGVWHHVAVIQDGSTARLFIDGAEITAFSTTTNSDKWFDDISGASGMSIGWESRASTNNVPFGGLLDDVAVFGRALTVDELKCLYDVAANDVYAYDVGEFNQLRAAHSQGGGASVLLDGITWSYATGLAGAAGLDGSTLVLDASAGTGLVSDGALMAHWTFDETSGQTAVDSAGTSDGILGPTTGVDTADPTIDQPGKLGRAYSFNANEKDVVTLAASISNFSAYATGTLVGWFNTSLTPRGTLISYRDDSTNNRLILEMLDGVDNGSLQFVVRENERNAIHLITTASFEDGVWHHVAVTQDGSAARLFVDGAEITDLSTNINSDKWFSYISSVNAMSIGWESRSANPNIAFGGLLDDFGVFGRALTADEVKCLYDVAMSAWHTYDVGAFNQLKMAHDHGVESVVVDGTTWLYATGLPGTAGLNGRTLVFDAAAGTGLRLPVGSLFVVR